LLVAFLLAAFLVAVFLAAAFFVVAAMVSILPFLNCNTIAAVNECIEFGENSVKRKMENSDDFFACESRVSLGSLPLRDQGCA
jgi:hypothetical protein